MLPKTSTIPTTRLSPKLKASSISTVTSAISKQTTLVLDSSSCHFPSLSLPPVQTSTSSVSSYSSTYTIVETSLPDLPTPTDEDIPISFNRSLPSWRRDPDRAKFVFGSLARSVVDVTSDGKSQAGFTNNGEGHLHSIAKPKAEGERNDNITPSLHKVSENCSILKDQRFESIIIAMGLNPLPSASTLHSDIGIFEDKDKGLGTMQLSKDHEMTHTGSTTLIDAMKSRESVVSDLLSWVESSSSSSCQ